MAQPAENDLSDFPTFDLSGKTALVTGATGGFGQRISLVLAGAGAKVAITGRREDKLNELKAEIESIGGKAYVHAFDITDVAKIPACLDACEKALGPVDILVNNAGVNGSAVPRKITPELYQSVMDTNVRAAFFMARDAGERMVKRPEGGRIINISSTSARHVVKGNTLYTMSKSAVVAMTRQLAREWTDLNTNLNVNALSAGIIDTPFSGGFFDTERGQQWMKGFFRSRIGRPQDLDGIILLLASDASRFITGADFLIDDGQTFNL